MEATFQFQALIEVSRKGYKWSDGGQLPILVYRDALGPDAEEAEMPPEKFRSYDPFRDEPALFQTFAGLDALPWPLNYGKRDDVARLRASILEFANKYGVPHPGGEFFQGINLEILDMRAAIELWEAGRQRDKESIAKYIRWDKRSGWNLSQSPLELFPVPDGWSDAPRGKDRVFQQAAELVDAIIAQKCSYAFQIKPMRDVNGNVTLSVEVADLVPVLWLQLAFAVTEDKHYRRCEVCNHAFELAPGENRADRRFCSDKCRIRAYRQRQLRAREMRAAGKHLREITRTLNTDLATAKKWVGEA